MLIGSVYTFRWKDIADCTILLSRDSGATFPEIIAANVLTAEVNEQITGTYVWEVTEPTAAQCQVKFVDNLDQQELLGPMFKISLSEYRSNFIHCVGIGIGKV